MLWVNLSTTSLLINMISILRRIEEFIMNQLPYAKFEMIRKECMQAIAQAGGLIKYAHSEVGNFTQGGCYYEQNEIEFNPTYIEDAADQLIIAKWMIRMIGHKHRVNISFAPKITVGKAERMHIHMKLHLNGKTATVETGKLMIPQRGL